MSFVQGGSKCGYCCLYCNVCCLQKLDHYLINAENELTVLNTEKFSFTVGHLCDMPDCLFIPVHALMYCGIGQIRLLTGCCKRALILAFVSFASVCADVQYFCCMVVRVVLLSCSCDKIC